MLAEFAPSLFRSWCQEGSQYLQYILHTSYGVKKPVTTFLSMPKISPKSQRYSTKICPPTRASAHSVLFLIKDSQTFRKYDHCVDIQGYALLALLPSTRNKKYNLQLITKKVDGQFPVKHVGSQDNRRNSYSWS